MALWQRGSVRPVGSVSIYTKIQVTFDAAEPEKLAEFRERGLRAPSGHHRSPPVGVAVACYVGCMELLTWMRENLGASKVVVKAASASASKPVASEPPKPDAPQETVIDLIKAAEKKFPEAKTGGKIPALRLIQGELGIGQPKAQQVQRHFKALAAAAG